MAFLVILLVLLVVIGLGARFGVDTRPRVPDFPRSEWPFHRPRM